MTRHVGIRLLGRENNERGDVFASLMSDLFLSLGYDNVRLNIARSGREIDIEAEHRLERRRAIAECKALEEKVGGKEVNAFAGKLRPERGRKPRQGITPYFVSLSGFTETSIDQEVEAGDEAVILVDGQRVVVELIRGRILAPIESAAAEAGRVASVRAGLTIDATPDLLAHRGGWSWLFYFEVGHERTHFVLIHADGSCLSANAALKLIEQVNVEGDELKTLVCLNPMAPPWQSPEHDAAALARYYEYLTTECGFILLDGLPADAEVGTLKLRLENLFVPLKLHIRPGAAEVDASQGPKRRRRSRRSELLLPFTLPGQTVPVGEALVNQRRLAVLASPGAGKSTLLKRLAVAYADASRRTLAGDELPDARWIPLFVRCRELREKARLPFNDLLDSIAARAFLGGLTEAFKQTIDRALRGGEVLLLIDGLDEIADAGDRAAFVRNLRTLLAVYPEVRLVLTSREAGFRHVAGLLAAVCEPAALAEFNNDDIRRLTIGWHHEVIGQRPEVTVEAERLAETISRTDRIRRLAVNPLLLTTLLLVKRWVGQLPTKRSVLYGKAVEVLLMTWNVEAHQPIEQDEALPQLCFLAYAMMTRGIQKISRVDLSRVLEDARQQLAAELAFARTGINEFIERVEHRSSLLMMTGVDVVDGSLVEFYEFRHLTFQEYLTAKAVIEGWYENRNDTDTLVGVLEPRFAGGKWREVVPLAAVLAGRKADPLIARLASSGGKNQLRLLATCLADEVQGTPTTIRASFRALLAELDVLWRMAAWNVFARSKYGPLFRQEAGEAYSHDPSSRLAQLLGDVVVAQVAGEHGVEPLREGEISRLLASGNGADEIDAALAIWRMGGRPSTPELAKQWCNVLLRMLSGDAAQQFAACLALYRGHVWSWASTGADIAEGFKLLIGVCQTTANADTRKVAELAVAHLPILQGDAADVDDCEGFVRAALESGPESRAAGFVAAYYLRRPLSREDLRERLHDAIAPEMPWRTKLLEIYTALSERI
jgi:hypothetical protein